MKMLLKKLLARIKRCGHCLWHTCSGDGHCGVDQEVMIRPYYPGAETDRVSKYSCTCGKVFYEDKGFAEVYDRWQNSRKPL